MTKFFPSTIAMAEIWVYGSPDMVGHMKTTVEINDSLILEARRLAESRGETMRSFLEEALRRLIEAYNAAEATAPTFQLTVVDGDGLVEGVTPASWLEIANERGSFTATAPR
jgi:hypothetical protein